jgi:hypothetical protein
MSRLVRIVIAVAVLALPAAAGAIIIKPTYVTNCHQAVYRPRSITLSCGDASTLLRRLSWTSWRARSASGDGQYAVNPCNPNCAAGKFKFYEVSVVLSRPRVCRKVNHLVFNRAAITFVNQKPGPDRTMRETLGCPL